MSRHALWPVATILLLASPSFADIKVLKHDEFSSDLFVAVGQVQGQSLPVQPGFAQDEAYGLIFQLPPGSFPVKVLGLQMLFAAPPNAPGLKSHLRIEFYFDESAGPAPFKGEPDWSVSTEDLYDPNTGATGLPIQGGVGVQIDFDWSDPANHPPLMTSGNLWVVLRFYQAPQDLSEEWGSLQCMKVPEFGACGCQKIGVLGDHAITPKVNVIHHVTSGCSGAKTWSYAENLGVTGDAVVRVKVETAGGCVPNCAGKQCGDDGCGGSCGTCPAGKHCAGGLCVSDCVPDCAGKECGDDGCGGSCGTCPAGKHCAGGLCVSDCIPDCSGKECGDDGCGGSCGECGTGEVCQAGACVPEPSGVVVLEVSPSFGYEDEETPITVAGHGFQPGLTLRLGGTLLAAIQVVGEGLATAVVPEGLAPGWYTLFASNPDGSSGFLKDAFEVRVRPVAADEQPKDTGPASMDVPAGDPGVQDLGPGDPGTMDTPPADTGAPTPSGGGCSAGATSGGVPWWLALAGLPLGRRPRRKDP